VTEPETAGPAVRARTRFSRGDAIDRAFLLGIIAKGLNGLAEILGGLILVLVTRDQLIGWLAGLANGELAEDPNDFIATRLLHWTDASTLTDAGLLFAGLYLLSHGVVKVVLVAAVLREKLWAYPWMLAFLVVFIGYQVYLLTRDPTGGLMALTCFDIALTWLTYREWHRRRASTRALHR
jgi:uncharacterized membrane protein